MHPCPTSCSANCKAKQSFDGKNSMNARNVRDCECCMNLELINCMVEVLTSVDVLKSPVRNNEK